MATLCEKFTVALELRGATRVKETFKYNVWTMSGLNGNNLYIGRAGAIRIGKTSQGSIPVSQKFKNQLLEEYDCFHRTGHRHPAVAKALGL